MRAQRLLVSLFLLIATLSAHAVERRFPHDAKRGTMSTENYPIVTFDGKERLLSAGAWIRNDRNRIKMPSTLSGQEFVVNYTENKQGKVDRVWILSPAEAKEPPPKKRPENQPTPIQQ